MTTTKTALVRVPTDARDELRRRAEEQGVTQGEVIVEMLQATAGGPYDVHALFDEIDRDWGPLMERLAR